LEIRLVTGSPAPAAISRNSPPVCRGETIGRMADDSRCCTVLARWKRTASRGVSVRLVCPEAAECPSSSRSAPSPASTRRVACGAFVKRSRTRRRRERAREHPSFCVRRTEPRVLAKNRGQLVDQSLASARSFSSLGSGIVSSPLPIKCSAAAGQRSWFTGDSMASAMALVRCFGRRHLFSGGLSSAARRAAHTDRFEPPTR